MVLLVSTSLIAGFLVAVTPGTTWYVDDDNCPGPGSGTLGDPFCSVQDAIDASSNDHTVLVASGTYSGTIDFVGKSIVVTSESGPGTTVLNGALLGSTVVFRSGEGLGSVLEGFTITGGTGTIDPEGNYSGGGIYCEQSSPTISGNIISGNVITAGSIHRGGGIACWDSSPLIQGNTITNNDGGTGNGNAGGGIFYKGASSPSIVENIITQNSARNGGGIHCNPSSNPAFVANNFIYGNSATNNGGGVLVNTHGALVDMIGNTIAGNIGTGIGCFGACTPSLTNCIVYGNSLGSISGPATVNYCNIEGGWGGGTGNIDTDPLFIAPGEYKLSDMSLCIDAGTNSVPGLPSIDIDGDPRIVGGIADIGADEWVPSCPNPASWAVYGPGYAGTLGIPAISVDFAPSLGSTVSLMAENSRGFATIGALFLGSSPMSVPLWGGTLLVQPSSVIILFIPQLGLSLTGTIPANLAMCGVFAYVQLLAEDPGAQQAGVSFTPGLELTLGY
jgi:hypothetical protein